MTFLDWLFASPLFKLTVAGFIATVMSLLDDLAKTITNSLEEA